MKLLLVEDDPLVGPAAKAVLEQAGYTIFGPLRDAVKAARVAGREQPDLALVDVHLPGGVDGLTLARRLWTEHRIPTLLMTGFDHHADEVRDLAVGLLRKPVMPATLIDAVGTVGETLAGLRPSAIPPALELFAAPIAAAASSSPERLRA
ncbi:response regulator [Azospirillum griseum]|uniref:Response regulator n=1 Tax=Azospirillum griseum TaxID=2496639 RepID=A0A3S0K6G8_9PROT|nr:response regulator [Azospirillum griseum]RTR22462.1 response regulator [Azospirillum griseum]